MGGGGKGGGGGDTTTTLRYAPYLEGHHEALLNYARSNYLTAVSGSSPYADYTAAEIEDAFFGAGYAIASFPSLYDMYGKFMAGLDIEVLWTQEFEDTVNSAEVGNLVSTEAALLDDDIETNILPRFLTGQRDLNAVNASSFVIGKAIVEDARVKALAKFDRELRYHLIPVAADRWKAHLQWNQNVIQSYGEIMKFYYAAKRDVDDLNTSMIAKDVLWPFTALEYYRLAVGTLNGATNSTTDVAGGSKLGSALSGAMSGAVAGGAIGYGLASAGLVSNPVGWGILAGGAVLGGLSGLLG